MYFACGSDCEEYCVLGCDTLQACEKFSDFCKFLPDDMMSHHLKIVVVIL